MPKLPGRVPGVQVVPPRPLWARLLLVGGRRGLFAVRVVPARNVGGRLVARVQAGGGQCHRDRAASIGAAWCDAIHGAQCKGLGPWSIFQDRRRVVLPLSGALGAFRGARTRPNCGGIPLRTSVDPDHSYQPALANPSTETTIHLPTTSAVTQPGGICPASDDRAADDWPSCRRADKGRCG